MAQVTAPFLDSTRVLHETQLAKGERRNVGSRKSSTQPTFRVRVELEQAVSWVEFFTRPNLQRESAGMLLGWTAPTASLCQDEVVTDLKQGSRP